MRAARLPSGRTTDPLRSPWCSSGNTVGALPSACATAPLQQDSRPSACGTAPLQQDGRPGPPLLRRRASLDAFLLGVLPGLVPPKMHPASMGRSISTASTGIRPTAHVQSWYRAGFSPMLMSFSAMGCTRLLPIPTPSVDLKVPN
ncbi:hypothetical protein ACQJBY_017245 [Aegilops geniculata]